MERIKLTHRDTLGCYYDDEEGNAWATFVIEPAGTEPCAACGKQIRSGYERISRDRLAWTYFCAEHVECIYPPVDREKVPAYVSSVKRWRARREAAYKALMMGSA